MRCISARCLSNANVLHSIVDSPVSSGCIPADRFRFDVAIHCTGNQYFFEVFSNSNTIQMMKYFFKREKFILSSAIATCCEKLL